MWRLSCPCPHSNATTITGIGAVVVAELRCRLGYPTVLDNLHRHMLRKLKAMELHQQGIVLPIIMRLLGHEDASTTAVFYGFVILDMISSAINTSIPAMDVPSENQLGGDKRQALYDLR